LAIFVPKIVECGEVLIKTTLFLFFWVKVEVYRLLWIRLQLLLLIEMPPARISLGYGC